MEIHIFRGKNVHEKSSHLIFRIKIRKIKDLSEQKNSANMESIIRYITIPSHASEQWSGHFDLEITFLLEHHFSFVGKS
jgi:hypothetical protein